MSDDTSTGTDNGEPTSDQAPAPQADPRVINGDQTPTPKPADTPPAEGDKGDEGKDDKGDGAKRTDWRDHARTWENRAKDNKTAADKAAQKATAAEEKLAAVLKAAGLTDESDEDPTEAVKRATTERDQAVAKAKGIEAERVAEKVARGLGADADRVLDSRAVQSALAELEDAADRDAVTAVIEKALEEHPHLKAATPPQSKPSGSTPVTGKGGEGKPSGGPSSPEDFRKLRAERRRF